MNLLTKRIFLALNFILINNFSLTATFDRYPVNSNIYYSKESFNKYIKTFACKPTQQLILKIKERYYENCQRLINLVKQSKLDAGEAILKYNFVEIEEILKYNFVEIEEILKYNFVDVNTRDDFGRTALIYSSYYGNEDLTKLLIANGAGVNITDNWGNTPLMYASVHRRPEIIKLLIEKGANINIQNNVGHTALMLAVKYKSPDIFIKLLIEKGANINIQDNGGCTALILAVIFWNPVVRLLIENNADVNIPNNEGDTALIVAAHCRKPEIVKILIENKADIKQYSKAIEYAKWLRSISAGATARKFDEIVKLLEPHLPPSSCIIL